MTLFRRLAFGMLALGLMTLPARADPKQLAGVAYEEIVRGEPVDGQPPALLVAFHYSGGSARESFENYDQVAGPVRILVPLGAHPKRQGLSYFPVDYYQRAPADQFRIARETVDRMADFLEAAETAYGRKPVVSGISQGGDISLLLAVYHPDRITAAFPFAAVIPDALTVPSGRTATNGPCIVAMQGEADAIVDVAVTRARVETLKAGLPLTLITYPGLGHDISPAMKADYTALIDRALQTGRSSDAAACAAPV